jgi:CBS domain containing-hemolysin-like protein
MWLGLLLVFFLVLVTAFFVAVEFALVSVRRTRIEQLATEGNASAKLVKRALDKLNSYLAAAQVGITMATIGIGSLGEPVVAQLFIPLLEPLFGHDSVGTFLSAHGIAFVLALLLVTIVELILGETVPKIAAIQRAEGTSMALIRPMNIFMLIFLPFIWLINLLSNAILRLLGLPQDATHHTAYTVEELEMIVTSSRHAGVLDREEEVILRRVFDFGELAARQVMVPRTEMEAMPVDATLQEALETIVKHRHTRFPLYEGDLDNIVGLLHIQDLFVVAAQTLDLNTAARGDIQPGDGKDSAPPGSVEGSFDLHAIMRPVQLVPETMDVAALLPLLQKSGQQMAIVVDEYGGTAGLVTLEDIIEEIVGEVRDEFEGREALSEIVTTPEGTLIDGLVSIDDVNDALDLGIESEAETIGGYVFEVLGRKPELGDEVQRNGHVLRVEELDGLRISKVRVLPSRGVSSERSDDE